MKIMSMLLAFFFCHSIAYAGITETGRGMLFGSNHTFFVSAVSGWVLDNQSGINQGLHMVFYPVGMTWADSPVIVYGRAVPKLEVSTIEAQVKKTIEEFHKNGNPNYLGEKKSSIKAKKGKEAEVYYFSGDQWGNYEAVAYYDEKDTINFVIYNARSKELFEKYVKDFLEIANSYENIYNPPSSLKKSQAEELIAESEKQLNAPGGKEYETIAIQASGQQMATYMRECTSYLPKEALPTFNLFIRINRDGTGSELEVYPANTLSNCFKGLMSGIKHPAHNFESFLLNIKIITTN
jgi:hypothetical protein